MACIVSSLTTTSLTEVYSSERDDDGKDRDEVSSCKITQELNEQVAHNKEHDESNIENNSNDVRDVPMLSNEKSSDQEKLENNEISSITINKRPTDGIDLGESTKENELQLDKKSCDIDNSSNVVKMLTKSSLIDDSIEGSNSNEILNKNSFIAGDNCHSRSPKCLEITKDESSLKNKSIRRITDSESEENIQTNESNNSSQMLYSIVASTTESYRALLDSESEEENTDIENNVPDMSEKIFENKNTKNYQSLIDSESEEESDKDVENNIFVTSEETSENKNIKKKLIKKRKGSIRASKDEAMRQIHSETQRLLRESEVSLPYHRPKQRTLKEFLNRKIISADLPKAPSTAVKLKMSSVIISQILAEKEKEAELFYKSSDSEDDVQSVSDLSKNVKVSSIVNEKEKALTDIDYMCTRDSEIKTNTQDSQDNVQEIVQKDFNEVDHQTTGSFSLIDNDNLNKPSITLKEITNECNRNLLKSSLPRKLFHTSENESNDIFQLNSEVQKTKEIVEPAIISLIEESCINNENEKDKNKITETFNSTNYNKETETFQNVSDTLNRAACANSDDRTEFVKDRNNEKEDECLEIDDVSLSSFNDKIRSEVQDSSTTEECEKSDSHVQGLPLPKFADESLSNKKILPALMSNSKVTLKGSPGMIIDLTDNVKPNLNRVNTLLNRFFSKHSNTKKQNDNTEVSVIHLENTPNGLLPVKEILPYKAPIDTDNSELNKPGAKLMRLKEDLKLQMTLKRNKEWKQKEMELQAQKEETFDAEEENDDLEKLCYESSDSNSDESEPEENDVCIKDKKRSKCLFADDEAEVTDDEDLSTDDGCNESDTDSVKYNKQSTSFNDVNEAESDQEEEEIDDDDDEDEDGDEIKNDNVDAFKTRCGDNDWMSENESNIPPCQPHAEAVTRSQVCKTPLTKPSMLDLVSPITQLSVLNTTLDSNKKNFLEESECLIDKNEFLSIENTQSDELFENLSNTNNKTILRKKLFDDTGETIDDEYLMQLCSGKFESTQKINSDLSSQINTDEIPQLRKPELCSVNSNAKLIDIKQSENSKINDKIVQGINLISDEDSNSINCSREKKVNAINSKLNLRVVSSDDDDEDTFLKPKKRPVIKLNLSDSEEENSQSSDVENEEKDEEVQYIDYDSEENEVTVTSAKNIKKVAADFLEEEAELSESDWDSADEDEKDLDKLEFEEADDEDIDEHKVKDQLERIHMKQILDEDKRDVRLLQELLFDDGDLHTDGNGRERKFKWKNIDKLGDTEMPQISDENDGWVDVQEDEEEAKWSKLRHERDKFLEERTKNCNNEIEDELYDSQIFKLGLEAVRKIKTNESQKQDTSPDKVNASENIEPIMPRSITDFLNGPNTGKKSQTIFNVIKKRSLLTRGEESLARIALLAKQGDSTNYAINKRNFVFPHIDQSTNNTSKKKTDITEDFDSQIKPGKRKMTLNASSESKKRRR
ncbi:hypothetical protein PUN28_012300 [Cardiocondyla obscurior]|uniref:Claspin n=1 Tax=Cardiocondyla obscurior TaxID=286306 RepID=A0AAW2FBR4_9HYME